MAPRIWAWCNNPACDITYVGVRFRTVEGGGTYGVKLQYRDASGAYVDAAAATVDTAEDWAEAELVWQHEPGREPVSLQARAEGDITLNEGTETDVAPDDCTIYVAEEGTVEVEAGGVKAPYWPPAWVACDGFTLRCVEGPCRVHYMVIGAFDPERWDVRIIVAGPSGTEYVAYEGQLEDAPPIDVSAPGEVTLTCPETVEGVAGQTVAAVFRASAPGVLKVYDQDGNVVATAEAAEGENTVQLPLPMTPGDYTWRAELSTDQGTAECEFTVHVIAAETGLACDEKVEADPGGTAVLNVWPEVDGTVQVVCCDQVLGEAVVRAGEAAAVEITVPDAPGCYAAYALLTRDGVNAGVCRFTLQVGDCAAATPGELPYGAAEPPSGTANSLIGECYA